MDVLQPSQELEEEVLVVLVRQRLSRGDDALQVTLEELRDDVQRVEVLRVGGTRHDVHDFDDVFVLAEVREQLDLPQNALGWVQLAGWKVELSGVPRQGAWRHAPSTRSANTRLMRLMATFPPVSCTCGRGVVVCGHQRLEMAPDTMQPAHEAPQARARRHAPGRLQRQPSHKLLALCR